MTLTEFVTARLDEDEAAAKDALSERWHIDTEGNVRDESTLYVATGPWDGPVDEADAAHIARHDPARVVREVEAKRKIVAAYQPNGQGVAYVLEAGLEFALGQMAAVWSDHPDYDPAWG